MLAVADIHCQQIERVSNEDRGEDCTGGCLRYGNNDKGVGSSLIFKLFAVLVLTMTFLRFVSTIGVETLFELDYLASWRMDIKWKIWLAIKQTGYKTPVALETPSPKQQHGLHSSVLCPSETA